MGLAALRWAALGCAGLRWAGLGCAVLCCWAAKFRNVLINESAMHCAAQSKSPTTLLMNAESKSTALRCTLWTLTHVSILLKELLVGSFKAWR